MTHKIFVSTIRCKPRKFVAYPNNEDTAKTNTYYIEPEFSRVNAFNCACAQAKGGEETPPRRDDVQSRGAATTTKRWLGALWSDTRARTRTFCLAVYIYTMQRAGAVVEGAADATAQLTRVCCYNRAKARYWLLFVATRSVRFWIIDW